MAVGPAARMRTRTYVHCGSHLRDPARTLVAVTTDVLLTWVGPAPTEGIGGLETAGGYLCRPRAGVVSRGNVGWMEFVR